MWVAIELATTLTTVLMVGIYRTHEALVPAFRTDLLFSWSADLIAIISLLGSARFYPAARGGVEIFHSGQRRHLAALFGTILVYMAVRPVIGEGFNSMVWIMPVGRAGEFDPALLDLAFVFLLLRYGTKVGLAPLQPGCRTHMPKDPPRCQQCCRDCC